MKVRKVRGGLSKNASEGCLVETFLPSNFQIRRLSREIDEKEVGLKCRLGRIILYNDIELLAGRLLIFLLLGGGGSNRRNKTDIAQTDPGSSAFVLLSLLREEGY